jgi:hypothetical protein
MKMHALYGLGDDTKKIWLLLSFTNVKVKGKGKVIPVLLFLIEYHEMKPYWGSGGIDPCIL